MPAASTRRAGAHGPVADLARADLAGAGLARADLSDVRAVLFDKDGTLLDFDATFGPATLAVLERLCEGSRDGVAALAAATGFHPGTLSFSAGSPIIAGTVDDIAPIWAERLGRAADAAFVETVDRLYREAVMTSLTAYRDVAPTLDRLRAAGYRLGLATNDSRTNASLQLRALAIADRFDFVAGYDSGFGAKPGPGMVLAFADRTGLAPHQIALVGDTPHDVATATAAGAVAVGICRTERARTALRGQACLLVGDLMDLLAALIAPTP